MTFNLSFDIEPDIHEETTLGITEGINTLLELLNKQGIKATFFTTCDVLEKHPEIFQKLQQEGHEIASHGYRHVRYEQLTLEEKKEHLRKSEQVFLKILGKKARGFRAPQHSIDDETLNLLAENNYKYDSSRTPLNFLQLIFFPKHWKEWKKDQGKNKTYMIRENLKEIPPTSLIIPFVSLTLRILPKPILWMYLTLLRKTTPTIVFYAHSWDFIKLPKSKIDKTFSHKLLLKRLDYTITYLKKYERPTLLEEL